MSEAVNTTVVPALRSFESAYVNDAYSNALEAALDALRLRFDSLTKQFGKTTASSFVSGVDSQNSKRFYKSIESVVGINVSNIIADEGLTDILNSSTRENVSLIRSIPEQYFTQIESLVFTGTNQGMAAAAIVKLLNDTSRKTRNRAKLISRDQTTKLNSAITQQRQQNLGIEEYVWVTSKDDRVRPTHRANDGKTFRWDDPPKATGHPGHDINCRCIAQPVIKI